MATFVTKQMSTLNTTISNRRLLLAPEDIRVASGPLWLDSGHAGLVALEEVCSVTTRGGRGASYLFSRCCEGHE